MLSVRLPGQQPATSKVLGEVKIYTRIFNCTGLAPLTPKLFQGQLYLAQQFNEISTTSLIFQVRSVKEKEEKLDKCQKEVKWHSQKA